MTTPTSVTPVVSSGVPERFWMLVAGGVASGIVVGAVTKSPTLAAVTSTAATILIALQSQPNVTVSGA